MTKEDIENEVFSEVFQYFSEVIEEKLDEMGYTSYSVDDITITLKENE